MMGAMNTTTAKLYETHDDVCPACGEGIDWEYGDHELVGEGVSCNIAWQCYDVAVLDMAHLNDD